MSEQVIVIGGGVIGLSAAVALAEAPGRPFAVEVHAEQVGARSSSRVAGAMVYPYEVAHPDTAAWLAESVRAYALLAKDPATGVLPRRGVEWFRGAPPPPGPRGVLPEFATCSGDAGAGFAFASFAVDMPRYLPWLEARARAAGVAIVEARIPALAPFLAGPARGAIVVNCTGARARDFAQDRSVRPTLGQIVRVERGDLDEFRVCDADPTRPAYVVPRADDCILGSISVPWPVDEMGYEPPRADAAITRDVIERCARLDPRVRDLRVLEAYCGLRPHRRRVRVERDERARSRLIHAYGHGGSGVTLAWGTAAAVVALANAAAAGGGAAA